MYSTGFLLHDYDRSLYCTRFLLHDRVHTVQDFYFMTRFTQYKIFTSGQPRVCTVQGFYFCIVRDFYFMTGFIEFKICLHNRVRTVQDFYFMTWGGGGGVHVGFFINQINCATF